MKKQAELAKLLTLLDDGDPRGMDRLARSAADRLPYIVGVTGAAGVGKSLLLSKLLEALCAGGRSTRAGGPVGVLAVDPTSPASGGALLGDRVRMPRLPAGVFLRSVATRGSTGGLSDKLVDMASAMKAFGYDRVFVETVGIGQDELAIRQVADTLIVVEAPGLGDDVQAMKATPLSVADMIVVNKSDKPGASVTAATIEDTIGVKPVMTSALEGDGIAELVARLKSAEKKAMRPKTKTQADRRKLAWRLTNALSRQWTDRIARESFEIVSASSRNGSVQDMYRNLQAMMAVLPDHVAVAVPDLRAAITAYRRLGFFLERLETFPAEKVKTAFFNAGGFHIELLQSTSPDSPIAKFVAGGDPRKMGGGLHHIAFQVADLASAERSFRSKGVETLGAIRPGTRGKRILFLHPKSACRVLLEFCACDKHAGR